MKTMRFLLAFSIFLATIFADTVQRPIQITDIFDWKKIQAANVSNDGKWFAYRLVPNEGDSQVVVRNLKDGTETRFPIGEVVTPQRAAAADGPPPEVRETGVEFSADGQWLAFTVYPKRADARKSKRDKKPAYNKVTLVEVATGKKLEFDKVKAYAFAGERGGWIALHKYTTEAQDKEPPPTKWLGSDLILHELATGTELNIGNVSEFAFNKPGTYLAYAIDAVEKTGNGLQLREMASGAVTAIDSGKASYKSINWTDKGDALAVLKGFDDRTFEDKPYSVVGAKDLAQGKFSKSEYNPQKDAAFPAGMAIAGTRKPGWTDDLAAFTFGIHAAKKRHKADEEIDKPDMLVWNWQDKRLQSMQQVQERLDRDFSYLSLYWVAENKFVRLADEKLRQVELAPKGKFAIGRDREPYELDGNLTGQRFEDIYVVDPKTGTRKLALSKNRWFYGPSPTGTHLLYYSDGNFLTYDMVSGQSKNLTQGAATSFVNQEDDHNVVKPPTRELGWASDGGSVLLSDGWDIWRAPIDGKPLNLTVNGKRDKIRYETLFKLNRDEKSTDLDKPVYLSVYGEWTKKGGVGLLDAKAPGVKVLLWDDAKFDNLIKAKKADVYLFTRQTVKDFPDYRVSGPTLASAAKVTEGNPQQKNFLWSSGARLVDYTCDQGGKAQAALFLPANYEPGKTYPTVVYIYEKLSLQMNTYSQPVIDDRFNRSVYNSNGYAVLTPDITYKLNDPGKSAVGCVVPALKAAIATGVIDAAKVGLQGHSWGGYETAFMVTQTNMFKTAIAGAPLTDMVSMYSSIYWNTGGANQAIFESSQGRFTSGYMDNPEPYIRNSPVYQAQNVKTPLMILHNDKDGAVDFTQGIEYYNTLRRLHKPVVMVEYKGENHHLSKPENEKDFLVRMKEYFDYYLMGKPEPAWLKDGVPFVQVKDEVEERAESLVKTEGNNK
jgi:dipeptidyl aminopeptidase/acylaminoacyl peptidase